jgi:hypothetical protein
MKSKFNKNGDSVEHELDESSGMGIIVGLKKKWPTKGLFFGIDFNFWIWL